MKKIASFILALVLCLSLSACNASPSGAGDSSKADNPAEGSIADPETADGTDSDYVKSKGTLIIGITEFEPMDYQDADGQWIGFDADMAKAFAESLGVTPKFQLIADWDSKVMELDGKTVDVVWNGMTLTDEVNASMSCSNPYYYNAQVAVVPADQADRYQTEEDIAGLQFAVENGSSGQAVAQEKNWAYAAVQDQATALLEVASGNADAAIIDYLMARAMTGEGTSYPDLTYTIRLSEEQYVVGFRKGSDLADLLNDFFVQQYAAGEMQRLAEAYGIADSLVEQA